jgi:hypothetical protein
MGDKIIITDEDEKPTPPPQVVVVEAKPKVEKVVSEKTTVVETRKE